MEDQRLFLIFGDQDLKQEHCRLTEAPMLRLQIRLRLIPLSPFIPGINENKQFGQQVEVLLVGGHGTKPVRVDGWGEVKKDVGVAVAAAGGVVPAGSDSEVAGVGQGERASMEAKTSW